MNKAQFIIHHAIIVVDNELQVPSSYDVLCVRSTRVG
jgi:hypothetical protein